MVKEDIVYTTSDGKQYKTKKSAERHENLVIMEDAGYDKKQVEELLGEIAKKNNTIKVLLENKSDWRDLPNHLVRQFPKLIEDHKNDVVTYQIVKVSYFRDKDEVILSERLPRIVGGEVPKEFKKYVNNLTEKDKDKNGSTFELDLYKEKGNVIKYKIVEKTLTPEDKMSKGKVLTEDDLRELVFERIQVYEEEGEDRRWSRSVTTVIEADDGNQYAINWEKGLTESQENEFYDQPQRVKVEEREVVKIVKEIIYLGEED